MSEQVDLGVAMGVPDAFCASPMQVSALLSLAEPISLFLTWFLGSGLLHLSVSIGVPDAAAALPCNSLPHYLSQIELCASQVRLRKYFRVFSYYREYM